MDKLTDAMKNVDADPAMKAMAKAAAENAAQAREHADKKEIAPGERRDVEPVDNLLFDRLNKELEICDEVIETLDKQIAELQDLRTAQVNCREAYGAARESLLKKLPKPPSCPTPAPWDNGSSGDQIVPV